MAGDNTVIKRNTTAVCFSIKKQFILERKFLSGQSNSYILILISLFGVVLGKSSATLFSKCDLRSIG
jgi:hypothetical protein